MEAFRKQKDKVVINETLSTGEHSKHSKINKKMILLVPEHIWAPILVIHSEFIITLTLFKAWLRYLKRLSSLSNKSWMLFIMSVVLLIRMPEAYALNVTVKSMSTLTSYQTAVVVPTADIFSLMKGKKPISIPENEVITSEDTEDYLEEDSEEDYDEQIKKENSSGEFFFYLLSVFTFFVLLTYSMSFNLPNVIITLYHIGMLVGSRCEFTCDKRLHHVFCSLNTNRCECEKNYPVKIGKRRSKVPH